MEFSHSAVVGFSGRVVAGGGGGGCSPLSERIAGFVSLLHCAVVIWVFVWFLSPPTLHSTRPPSFFSFFLFPLHFSVLRSS